ncbi:hypothetical protein GCM10023340_38820 [Nocardioides marinquilinus]|uniref:DUF935 family protein n=1 Tax=Nocardioides marinquilinus TaxID=1210400 RepID=A0ABP9Q2A4_9ACTN
MTVTQVPRREVGYANPGADGFWDTIAGEQVPELQWPFCIPIYQRMQTDAQIASVLQAVMAPILRTGWGLDARHCDNEVAVTTSSSLGLRLRGDTERRDFAAQLRGRDRFSWNQHLYEACDFLAQGHSVFNQVARWDDEISKWRLRKLGWRPPATIAKWNIADDGGLISVEQHPRGASIGGVVTPALTATTRTTKIDRLVVYAHGRRGANWRGVSVLRACYKNWLLKDDGNRSWAIGVARNSMGLPVHTASDKGGQAEIDAGLTMASRARAGSNAGLSLANGATFDLLGVKGQLIDPDKFVRYHDEQIARAVLAHFLNLGTQTGSWALGSTFADFFTLSLQAIAEEIRDIATAHIVEDLVDWNFGRNVPAPRVVFDEIGSRRDAQQALDDLRKLAGLEDDEDMATFIRENVPDAA